MPYLDHISISNNISMESSYISTSSEGVFTHSDNISICSDVIAFPPTLMDHGYIYIFLHTVMMLLLWCFCGNDVSTWYLLYTCGDNISSMLAVWRVYPSSGNFLTYTATLGGIFTWISHPCSESNQNASRQSRSHSDYGARWVDNVS